MKNEGHYAKKLNALLRRMKSSHRGGQPEETDPVAQLVIGFLEWNATRTLAQKAFDKLMERVVDINDLRVSLPKELIEWIGEGYPDAQERITRLRESLHEIYLREHNVTLESISGRNKKQVTAYLETLPGMVPYVSSQIMLLNYGFHTIPLDDRMTEMLKIEEVLDEEATAEDTAHFIERQVKAGDGVTIHAAMRSWADRKSRSLVTAAKSGAAPRKKSTKTAPRARKKK